MNNYSKNKNIKYCRVYIYIYSNIKNTKRQKTIISKNELKKKIIFFYLKLNF